MFKVGDVVKLTRCAETTNQALKEHCSISKELYGDLYVGKIGVVEYILDDVLGNALTVVFNKGLLEEVEYIVCNDEVELV